MLLSSIHDGLRAYFSGGAGWCTPMHMRMTSHPVTVNRKCPVWERGSEVDLDGGPIKGTGGNFDLGG